MKVRMRFRAAVGIIAALMAVMVAAAPPAFAAEYKDRATVKRVQQALNERGYDCGTPDGSSGKKTRKAIEDFQKSEGLEVTGAIDDRLWEALGMYEAREALIGFHPSLPELDRDYLKESPHVWAGCAFNTAMLKLKDAGVLEADPWKCDYPLKKNLKGAFPMIFKNKKEGKKLTDTGFRLGPGRYMICRESTSSHYANKEVENMHVFNFYRVLSGGGLGYSDVQATPSEILEGAVDVSRLAWDIDACDYIIVMGGYLSLSDENYYMYDIDRYGRTMIVFVIDARDLTCLHIECVSTDLPGSPTKDNHGTWDYPSAETYVAKLLKG